MVILQGCATVSYEYNKQQLPDFPLAGSEVAENIESICKDQNCDHLNEYLNKLYLFKKLYMIHKK